MESADAMRVTTTQRLEMPLEGLPEAEESIALADSDMRVGAAGGATNQDQSRALFGECRGKKSTHFALQ